MDSVVSSVLAGNLTNSRKDKNPSLNEQPIKDACPKPSRWTTDLKIKVKGLTNFYDESLICSKAREKFTSQQIAEYREAYRLFDKDNNGLITTAEVHTVLRSMGQDPTDSGIQGMFNNFDLDGSGYLEFPEFIRIVSHIQEDEESEEDLIEIFRIIDYDGDGYITKADLRKTVVGLKAGLSNADLEEMIEIADKDGDGMIDFEEFVRIILSQN